MRGCFALGTAVWTLATCLAPIGCGGSADDSGNSGEAGAAAVERGGSGTGGEAGASAAEATNWADVTQPECADDALACNGVCVGIGQSLNGCTVLGMGGERGAIDHGMTLDSTHIYWVEQGGRVAVARSSKAGGERQDLVVTEDIPFSPATNSTLLYFIEGGFDEYQLSSVAKTGGAVTVLSTHPDSLASVVATETRVYFSREYFLESRREVVSVPVGGGAEVVHGQTGSFGDNFIAVDSTHVYWANDGFFDDSTIERATLDGTTSELLVADEGIRDFEVVDGTIYYYSNGVDAINRVPTSGGTPELVYRMAEAPSSQLVLAATEQHIYWNGTGRVWRVGTDGSAPTVLMATSGTVTSVVVDDSGVYAAVNANPVTGPAFLIRIDEP